MEEKEIDLDHVNEIDMEMDSSLLDDEDDSFGGFVEKQPIKKEAPKKLFGADETGHDWVVNDEPAKATGTSSAGDGRDVVTKTGIVLNFSDGDEEILTKDFDNKIDKVNVVNFGDEGLEFSEEGEHSHAPQEHELTGYNEIDMETDAIPDDDEFGFISKKKETIEKPEIKKELVDDEIVEAKKKVTSGEVEDDYWKKMSKKHEKTNVKGAYNMHFHFAGDPEQEMKDFNHDMGNVTKVVSATPHDPTDLGGGASMANDGVGAGEGCCEDLHEDYNKLFEDLLIITGFKLVKDDKGNCSLKDLCNIEKDQPVASPTEAITSLKPYIDDCFIYPLQLATGENYTTCDDWCKWYKGTVQTQHPELNKDIKYCDLIANHLNDVKF